jgi:hypothetical protein
LKLTCEHFPPNLLAGGKIRLRMSEFWPNIEGHSGLA